MQRLNRSAAAPKGPAFLLFLGLAIVPISLKAAGIQVSFSPRMSAAADALQQIANVFGSGYQPSRTFVSSTPSDRGTDSTDSLVASNSAYAGSGFACIRETDELSLTMKDVVVGDAAKYDFPPVDTPNQGCARTCCRIITDSASAPKTVAIATTANRLQSYKRAMGTPNAMNSAMNSAMNGTMNSVMKLEAINQCALRNKALLRDIQTQIVERSLSIPAIPQSLWIVVRAKSPATPSATRAAQCKVRAALDSVRRVERERAMLTGLSSADSDNCEL